MPGDFRTASIGELPDDEAVLTEVQELRTLFLNLQFGQARGPMTAAEMRRLIEQARRETGDRGDVR